MRRIGAGSIRGCDGSRGRITRRRAMAALSAMLLPAVGLRPAQAGVAAVRLAVLQYGTVAWELDTIRRLGLDRAEGVEIEVQGYASGSASQIAFLGGEADAMVTDWLWVARQRAAGRDVVFLPYSRAVGGIMVPPESDAAHLSDLAGQTIGIAGGPLDKSWLILQAHASAEGFDLAGETRQVFGAPPLISQKAREREIGAVLNYWHYQARLEADGFRTLVGTADAAGALGLGREVPLLGYVFHGEFLRTHPQTVEGFARASRAAKRALREDAAWEPLRPMMKPANEAEFRALIAGYRAGIPSEGPVDRESAAQMFALMAEAGGEALVGTAKELPDGVFLDR